jgi:hypothetical protein
MKPALHTYSATWRPIVRNDQDFSIGHERCKERKMQSENVMMRLTLEIQVFSQESCVATNIHNDMLKIWIISGLLFCLVTPSVSQKFDREGSKWVSAKSGLRMRESADINGIVINTIPYGERVQFFATQEPNLKLANTEGKWSRVKWKNQAGWVFGGFLSDCHPDSTIEAIENTYYSAINSMYSSKWGSSLPLCRIELYGSGFKLTENGNVIPGDEDYIENIVGVYHYENGILVRINQGYEWGGTEFKFDAKLYSIEEIFDLACQIYSDKYSNYLTRERGILQLPISSKEQTYQGDEEWDVRVFKALVEDGKFKYFKIDEEEGCGWSWFFEVKENVIIFGDSGGC